MDNKIATVLNWEQFEALKKANAPVFIQAWIDIKDLDIISEIVDEKE